MLFSPGAIQGCSPWNCDIEVCIREERVSRIYISHECPDDSDINMLLPVCIKATAELKAELVT